MRKKILAWTVWGGVLVVDQLSKLAAINYGWGGLNYKGVLGWGDGQVWSVLAGVILAGLLIYGIRMEANKTARNALGLIWWAGVSNYLDRIRWEGVWDWICYPYIKVCGNIADIFILVGVGWYVVIKNKKDKDENII